MGRKTSPRKEAVADGTVTEETIQPSEAHATKQKKDTLMQETRYGAKPSTPAKLRHHNSTARMTPAKRQVPTPSSSKIVSRVSSAVATMRSPRAGRVAKGTSPRVGGKPQTKNKKLVAAQEQRLKRGILTDNSLNSGNDTILRRGAVDLSVASSVPDYGSFKQGNMLNSTEAITPEVSHTRGMPSYMTPTQNAQNRMFKTPTTPRSRSRLTPGGSSAKIGRASCRERV